MSAKQDSLDTFAVTFPNDVSKELTASDFTVINSTTLIRQDIKSLTFSEDGKTCYLEMYLDLSNNNIYEITCNGLTEKVTASAGSVTNVVISSKPITYGVATSVDISNLPGDIAYTSGSTAELSVGINLFSYDASGNKVAIVTTGYGYTITKSGATESSTVTAFTGDDNFVIRSESDNEISFNSGVYTVKVYLSSDGSSKEGLVTSTQFTVTNSQATPTITQDKKAISDGDATAILSGSPSSLTNYFTINANGASGTLSVDSVTARRIGNTLLVEAITIRETFADGNSILHSIVKNFTLSIQ